MKTVVVGLILCAVMLPQTPQPAAIDVHLYMAFFHFHHGLSTWSDGKKAKEPSKATALDAGTARLLKINVTEVQKLRTLTDRVTADLDKTEDDAQALIKAANAKKQNPDVSALRRIEAQRQQIVLSAIGDLKSILSATSWQGLQSYIEHEYSSGIQKFAPLPVSAPVTSRP